MTTEPSAGDDERPFRCGFVAVIGRPNVGKSTLLNRLVGQKLAITSDKAQTTRHRLTGVVNLPRAQLLVLDSPGVQSRERNALNRVLNRTALQVAQDADVVLFVADARGWRDEDGALASRVRPRGRGWLLALNKLDEVRDRASLFKWVPSVQQAQGFDEIVPISARTGFQVDTLAEVLARHLPEAPPAFEADELTDRSERFLAAEIVREKLFRTLGAELPYDMTVLIERFELEQALRRIHATILVARDSQKGIVLGRGGERIKRMATEARLDLEKLFGAKVYLELFVKVRSGWADNEQSLRAYGYE
ncbi:MAG: GTPase Era [Burkholderiaceae bacterium]